MIGGKQIGGPRSGKIKMDMEWRSLRIFYRLRISHPRGGNHCVCDGRCTHTPCRTHIFLTQFLCVMYRQMAQGVCSAHVISLHLTLSILMFHPPSLLFPHGHFQTTFPSAQSSPDFTRPESTGQAHFRTNVEEFGYLADPTHSTGCEAKEFDKITSADWDMTPINDPNHDRISNFTKKRTREHWTVRCSHSVWNLCFARFLWWVCSSERNPRKHASGNRCWTQRQEQEGSVISVAVSMSRKSWRSSIRSHSLQTHREFYSWWTRSPRRPGTKSSTRCFW